MTYLDSWPLKCVILCPKGGNNPVNYVLCFAMDFSLQFLMSLGTKLFILGLMPKTKITHRGEVHDGCPG